MVLDPSLIQRLAANNVGMGPCISISRITALKRMAAKIFIQSMNSLFTNKLSWMKKPEINYLMLTPSTWKI